MSHRTLSRFFPLAFLCGALAVWFALPHENQVRAAGPIEQPHSSYRVLAPLESGNLLLFPVVKSGGTPASPFLTLDEGFKNGEVEVVEAGRVHGLVRPRPTAGNTQDFRPFPVPPGDRGDQVNTLVLVNHSDKPLLLLAGEIVTGGKQDRIIAKDRIVPAGSDPIDLNVFCIEHGRWTATTSSFGASAGSASKSLMVQPSVRAKAMVEKDQQEVWNSVHGSIADALAAPASPNSGAVAGNAPTAESLGTTSYVRAMQSRALSDKVDQAAATLRKSQRARRRCCGRGARRTCLGRYFLQP
jgi:hypothetical protein